MGQLLVDKYFFLVDLILENNLIRFFLVEIQKVVVHHRHCQVYQEIRANYDQYDKKDGGSNHAVAILNVHHDGGPTLQTGALKDRQKTVTNVVKIC